MLKALVHTSVALHAVATGFYLAYLVRFRPEVGLHGRRALWAAVAVMVAALTATLAGTGEVSGSALHRGLFHVALGVDLVYLLLMRGRRRDLVGSFVVPASTALLLALLFAQVATPTQGGVAGGGALLVLHVGASLVGCAAFSASFLFSAAYLARDFALRTKTAAGGLAFLPPLARLERWAHRMLLLGFPIYTMGLLLGGVRIAQGPLGPSLEPQVLFAVVSWAIFGVLLLTHATSGWRGARAAILNAVGFLLVTLTLLIYALRDAAGA